MAQPAPARSKVQFGPFTADLRSGELRKYGIRVKLQDRPFQILIMLLERPGQVVTREDIRTRLWPDGRFVDFDSNISSSVGKLRAALGDSAAAPRYIETVGRHGYRFIAELAPAKVSPALVELPAPATQPGPDESHLPASPAVRRPWLVLVAMSLIGVALLAYLQWSRARVRPQPGGKLMLAVLPFTNLTGDPAQEYISDGFTEGVIARLGRLDPQHFGVIARTSVMPYQGGKQRLMDIGRELGVQYVLEGSVGRSADEVQVRAQLNRVKDHTHLWAREYDRPASGLLDLQSEIAEDIAHQLQAARGGGDLPAVQRMSTASNYEAYDLYLRGLYFWDKRTKEGFQQAIEYFQQAIAVDPNYAQAYAGLADTYALMSNYFFGSAEEFMPKARSAALRALQLDDNLAEAHTALALIYESYDWDWSGAEKEFRRAIELNPNYATAHHWYSEFLTFQGRFDDALAESDQARKLDPLSLIIAADHAATLYFARRYDPAIAEFRAVQAIEPDFPRAHLVMFAYAERGMFAQASAELENWRRSDADDPWLLASEAYLAGRMGQEARAKAAMRKLEQVARYRPMDPTSILIGAYAATNDREKAIATLQRAYREHANAITQMKVDPIYDPLRGDKRFQQLLRRVHLEE
jgi:TolB-like protein/DNA-binding winged helix-turn-helix (wHTH) protein/Tfp pilus assembly protein PilF